MVYRSNHFVNQQSNPSFKRYLLRSFNACSSLSGSITKNCMLCELIVRFLWLKSTFALYLVSACTFFISFFLISFGIDEVNTDTLKLTTYLSQPMRGKRPIEALHFQTLRPSMVFSLYIKVTSHHSLTIVNCLQIMMVTR